MNNFKGTPGRWIKRGDGIVAPGDIEVAVVVNFQDDEAMDADANLIAAAPELLEALTSTLDEIGFWLSQQKPELRDKLVFAVAKALGESQ